MKVDFVISTLRLDLLILSRDIEPLEIKYLARYSISFRKVIILNLIKKNYIEKLIFKLKSLYFILKFIQYL